MAPKTKGGLLGGANAARERVTGENILKNSAPAQIFVCPSSQSPNARHWYLIEHNNHGVCLWCQRTGYFPSYRATRR